MFPRLVLPGALLPVVVTILWPGLARSDPPAAGTAQAATAVAGKEKDSGVVQVRGLFHRAAKKKATTAEPPPADPGAGEGIPPEAVQPGAGPNPVPTRLNHPGLVIATQGALPPAEQAPAANPDPTRYYAFPRLLPKVLPRLRSISPCCTVHHNDFTCSSAQSEYMFIFGSCRMFYSEPCRTGPDPYAHVYCAGCQNRKVPPPATPKQAGAVQVQHTTPLP
jgi:hypothetical protein